MSPPPETDPPPTPHPPPPLRGRRRFPCLFAKNLYLKGGLPPPWNTALPRQFDPSPPPVDAINHVPTGLAESLTGYLANDLKFDARQFGFVCIADGMFTVRHFKICRHTTQFR